VNVNLLAADGPDELERVSGMAHLTGIPVDVRPAAGPQATDDWSGIGATPVGRSENGVPPDEGGIRGGSAGGNLPQPPPS
jgi:hypothetical protein